MELLVVFLMILDMLFYYQITKNQNGAINVLEYFIVGAFIGLFFYIGFKNMKQQDEELEIALVIFRLVLQIMRITVGIIKIGENF